MHRVTFDQTIKYSSKQRDGDKLYPVRRIGYHDPETGQRYVFITNHFGWSAQTIADIHKQRWQVKLFFKWVKQNLKIKPSWATVRMLCSHRCWQPCVFIY
jgi:IS4 transposase